MAHLKDLLVNGDAKILGEIHSPKIEGSISMGRADGVPVGKNSTFLGFGGHASGDYSFAEGYGAIASGEASHAEGQHTGAEGESSHAEGSGSIASGYASHAEGWNTIAAGAESHAEGMGTVATRYCQHVQGAYNVEDVNSNYLHIVGNGLIADAPSNAHTLDWNGEAWFAGDVYVKSTSGTNKDSGSKKLATTDQIPTVPTTLKNPNSLTVKGNGTTSFTYDGSAAKSLNIKPGTAISVSSDTSGNITIGAQAATKDTAGVTVVYPAASCTAYSSDTGTCTPKAVQQGAKQFAIPRVGYTSNTDLGNTTDKAIVRFNGTESEVQDSKIIIEDVTNTADSKLKAQVIAIPAEGNKKMVYGYCTDQVDGTSFIGGIFDKSATSYPYASGLAIGGTSGNLLWKGQRVLDNNDLTTINNSLSSKAALASPTFTGTPKAPTASAGTNTTQIATTAFVKTALDNKITYGTTDLTEGTSTLATGTIYLVYE